MPKILEYKIVTIVIMLLVAWLGLLSLGTYRANQLAEETLAEVNSRIFAINQDNKRLEDQKIQYNTPTYLEKQARIKLNYKAADEQVVFIYADEEHVATNSAKPADSGVLRSVLKYFSGFFAKIF